MNFAEDFRGRERAHVRLHHRQTMPLPTLQTKTEVLPVYHHRQDATQGRSLKSESGKILPYFRAKAGKVKCGAIVVRVKKSKSLDGSPIKTARFKDSNA